jgi:hypothetical protein
VTPSNGGNLRDAPRVGVRIATEPKQSRDSISPEFKAYLNERRRALITELTALDKLLGRETIK